MDPVHLDRALQRWNRAYGKQDETLAIDVKTMFNSIDEQGHQTPIMRVIGHQSKACYTQKFGSLPIEGDDKLKSTSEIKMAIPLFNAINIQKKDITADAPLTQRKLADCLCEDRKAHYHFTVRGNQPRLFEDISLYCQDFQEPDFLTYDAPDHGRIEIRKIWTTTELNGYLDFPHVEQAFVIRR